jgi:hypothetical protein
MMQVFLAVVCALLLSIPLISAEYTKKKADMNSYYKRRGAKFIGNAPLVCYTCILSIIMLEL